MSILLILKVKNDEKLKNSLWRVLIYKKKKEDLNAAEDLIYWM